MPIFRLLVLVFIYLITFYYYVSASDITLGSLGNNFSIPVNIGTAYNLEFANDGKFMYLASFDSNVYQFSLPTAYDITSAVYMNRTKSLSAQGSGMDEIRMKNDGTKLYVLQFYSNAILQYTLTTPYNILSTSYENVSKGLTFGNNYSFYIKPDGTKFYTLNDYSNFVLEYTLSTPWNFSTASANPTASLPTPNFSDGQKLALTFTPDGGSMYIETTTSERIHWMSFATPWVLSTATYTSGKYVGFNSTDNTIRGIVTNDTGSKLFFIGNQTKKVYEFNLTDIVVPTITSIASSTVNGSYKAGDTINVTVYFSESVTSTGNVTVTLETGDTDRTCTFTVTSSSSASCTYTVQAGDISSDLSATVSGTIKDASNNSMSNFTPTNSLESLKALVIDTTTPTISSESSSSIGNSAATITWNTNEITSSKVTYGPSTNLEFQTSESDTGTRVLSHSVNLTSLKSCTIYYYKVTSRDTALNSIQSSNFGEFITTGCGISNVLSGSSNKFSLSGGTLTLPNSNSIAKIIIPNNYYSTLATFQINKLDATVFSNPPTNNSLADNNIFKLNAIDENNSNVGTFNSSVTFEISYPESITDTLDENSFDIYKYNGSTWDKKNCSVDKTSNTVSCSLTSFSIYGLFGELFTQPSSQNQVSGGGRGKITVKDKCKEIKPLGLTWMRFEKVNEGMKLNWSLIDSDKVDILIDDGTGNYPFKVNNLKNDGSEILKNVESWQNIKILPKNGCVLGEMTEEFSKDKYPNGWYNQE